MVADRRLSDLLSLNNNEKRGFLDFRAKPPKEPAATNTAEDRLGQTLAEIEFFRSLQLCLFLSSSTSSSSVLAVLITN